MEMFFIVDVFISGPKLSELAMLKRSELVVLANYYKLEVNSESDTRKVFSDHLVVIPDDDIVVTL